MSHIICQSCESIYTQASHEIESLEQKLAKAREALVSFRNDVENALLLDESLTDAWDELKNASDKAREALKEIE